MASLAREHGRSLRPIWNNIKQVSILGCGWLGYPLAKRLYAQGYQIKGSTTQEGKVDSLTKANIKAYRINYNPQREQDCYDFFQSDIVFINIPFRRNLADPQFYVAQIKAVIDDISKAKAGFVIFASSTVIYSDKLAVSSEDALVTIENERMQALYEAEQQLCHQAAFDTTIIRFGGLVGGDRRIGHFLTGKNDVTDPDRPVNLIHLDDCLNIVSQVIHKDVRGEILNAVTDKHPTRMELYTKAAISMDLPPPQFKREGPAKHYKVVPNDKLKKMLSYQFRHPDPMGFI